MTKIPKSVVIISSYSDYVVGGLGTYIRLLTDCLQKQGTKIDIIARFYKKAPPATAYAESDVPAIVPGVNHQTHIIAPHKLWKPVLARLNKLIGKSFFQEIGIRLYSMALGQPVRSALPKSAEVIHYVGTGWELFGYIALTEAKRLGAAFTIWPAVHPGDWGDGAVDLNLYKQADAIFTQSNFEKKHLIGLGIDPGILHVCGLCPATEELGNGDRFREKYDLGDKPVILFVGRKSKSKGYHALCEAFPAVLASVPNAVLCVIGPDNEPPYPEIPEKSLLDFGIASDQEKADALAACDIFCMPSTAEAFGIVYVEAWANAKPVVAGMAPAVQELVEDGVDGYCVPQKSAEIAEKLVSLLQNNTLRQQMGRAGFAKQQKLYTKEAILEQHNEIFQSLLPHK